MSKTGQSRIERQETEDYKFGWESADRGEPYPNWPISDVAERGRIENQRMGWSDYHNQEKSV